MSRAPTLIEVFRDDAGPPEERAAFNAWTGASPMTPLPLDRPLAGLLDARAADGRKLSQRDLGELRQPIVTQGSVAAAVAAGSAIKLSTLDAYARAAGYRLIVAVEPLEPVDVSQDEPLASSRRSS